MKKFTLFAMLFSFFAVGFILAAPQNASAQQYYRKVHRAGRTYWVPTRKPSFYRRHRNLINIAAATGGGALLGGIIGGRKGMLIGSGIGAGSGALYTYALKPKKRHYRKIPRHYHRQYRRW
ncbi:MAG: hypothetical protein DYH05_09020 [Acidobacteria bacterium ACB1]|nr:hypothetical protein [Acidobacteria bacterium ACB1]RIJ95003.1 MAG: hypothetical protein DCC44_02905 [Acidobacteriota bacterium]